MPLTYLRCVRTIPRLAAAGARMPPVRPTGPPEDTEEAISPSLSPPRPATASPGAPLSTAAGGPGLIMPTTAETVAALRRRFTKELYQLQADLVEGGRIAGKPCDCFTKHRLGLEVMAEELFTIGACDVCHDVLRWLEAHAAEFEVEEVANRPPEYYKSLAPEVRDFRKRLMGSGSNEANIRCLDITSRS